MIIFDYNKINFKMFSKKLFTNPKCIPEEYIFSFQ